MTDAATLVTVPCLLCGSTDALPARVRAPREDHAAALGIPDGRSRWVVCSDCGLVFQSPRLPPGTLSALYDDGEYHTIRGGVPEHYVQYSLRRSRAALDWGLRCIGGPPGEALDIGCGIGGALVHLRDRGWRVQGIEPDTTLAEVGRSRFGLEIRTGLFDDRSYPSGTEFDLAYSCHVWEHLLDPVATTTAAADLLRARGGHLLVVVPTFRSARTNAWACFTAPHTYMFTDVSLGSVFTRAGLEVVASRFAAGADSELWMLGRARSRVGTEMRREDPLRIQRELARVPLRAPLGLPSRLRTHVATLADDPKDFVTRLTRWSRQRIDRVRAAVRPPRG